MCPTLRLLVLISIVGCVELITVNSPHKQVNVIKGGSALLQCTFETIPETTGLIIQWDFVSESSETQQVYYYQSGKYVISKSYEGRIQSPTSPGTTKNASILITNMQMSDAGIYTCQVHNYPDVDGKSEASIVVKVYERPSVPYCAVHGDVESGHLVTLTCHSEHGNPKPTYTWTHLDATKTKARRPVPALQTGTLQIRNISEFQFGEYMCNATNVVGFSACTVELSPEVGDGVIAAAVVGGLLGCVLIVLLVWFVAHTLKKHSYRAVKGSEATEMKGRAPQAHEASDSVTVATTDGNLHAEAAEPQT